MKLPRHTAHQSLHKSSIVYSGSEGANLPFEIMMEAYNFRSRVPKSKSTAQGVPEGYVSLDKFNKTTNIYGRYSGLKGTGVNEKNIYVKLCGDKALLWWENPKEQIDDFLYTGDRQDDIDDCVRQKGEEEGYTWHHTGFPHEETHGTMQLVPTVEHEKLSHWGGAAISAGKLTCS